MTLRIDATAVPAIRNMGGRWAVYENRQFDSHDFGRRMFLAVGPGRTHEKAPDHLPDSQHGTGWKYLLLGEFESSSLTDEGDVTLIEDSE